MKITSLREQFRDQDSIVRDWLGAAGCVVETAGRYPRTLDSWWRGVSEMNYVRFVCIANNVMEDISMSSLTGVLLALQKTGRIPSASLVRIRIDYDRDRRVQVTIDENPIPHDHESWS